MNYLIVYFVMLLIVFNSKAGTDAFIEIGHFEKETLILETHLIKNKKVYSISLENNKKGNKIKVVPQAYYQKILSEIGKWASYLTKKDRLPTATCHEFISLKLKGQSYSICTYFLSPKDKTKFSKWYEEAYQGY